MNIVTILMVLPLLVALTNMLTNVLKGLSGLLGDDAKSIAPMVGEVLTRLATAAYLEVFSVQATWYWYAGGAIAGGVVAYVAMNGYDGLYEDLIKHLKGLAGSGDGK